MLIFHKAKPLFSEKPPSLIDFRQADVNASCELCLREAQLEGTHTALSIAAALSSPQDGNMGGCACAFSLQ